MRNREHQAKRQKVDAEERSEWERLMDEDGPPDEWDEPPMRYDSGEEWEQRLREEGAGNEDAEEWGWCGYQPPTPLAPSANLMSHIELCLSRFTFLAAVIVVVRRRAMTTLLSQF